MNSYTGGFEHEADVAADSGGRFVVVWHGGPDGSNGGVHAQRFALAIALDVDGNGVVDALTHTLMALRYAFGFRNGALIVGAVAPDCTRCDAPAIEAHLAGLTAP